MKHFSYPKTFRDDSVEEILHQTTVKDPYRWLENPDSEETKKWIESQQKLTDQVFQQFTHRKVLFEKLKEMQNFPKYGCPFKRGNNYFFWKNDGLQNQSVLYMQETLSSEPKVFLDPNKISKDGTVSVGTYSFSESGQYMAYSLHQSGSDWQTICIRDTKSCTDLEERIEWVRFSNIAWSLDNKGFYYAKYPPPQSLEGSKNVQDQRGTETDSAKNQKVYYHTLGTSPDKDELIFCNPEQPDWMYGMDVSDDGRYLILTVHSDCAPVNRFYYLDLQSEKKHNINGLEFEKLIDNFEASYSYITNDDTIFYLETNKDAPKQKVISIDIKNPKETKDIIPESNDVISSVTCVNEKFVVVYMHDVKEIIQLYNMDGKLIQEFPLPTLGSISGISGKRKHKELFFSFTSFLYPGVIYHHDFEKEETKVFREISVPNLDPSLFETKQIFYQSKDNTKIPMFVTHKKGLNFDGNNPTLLYGYGGFNISLTPGFSVTRVIWMLYFNGVLAIPNLRGGNEYGEEWHQGGIKEKKQNVFNDFMFAAKHLIDQKYTSPERLAIMGGSNGGLLVSACINQRPELFGCAIAQVPVTDMLRFHKFTIGYAWCSDYGCADNSKDFEYLIKYSPLHTVKKGTAFPALLVTTADHDDRVVPLHSFKYISEVQHQLGNEEYQKNPLVIRIESKAGHGHGKPMDKILEEAADTLSFIAYYTNASFSSPS